MLNQIFENTSKYKTNDNLDSKKKKGQYFTSLSTARFMGEGFTPISRNVKILDPGAGNGSLGASIIENLVQNKLCDKIDITFVENDVEVLPVLRETASIVENYCKTNNVTCRTTIMEMNYILADIKEKFDVVICNPPYKKIRKDSEESNKMSEYVYGQPNLYSLFMAKSVDLLKKNGGFIFITPRSWTSGAYFSVVRTHLADQLSFEKIHIFDDRDSSFSDEEVLQETMILFGTKKKQQDRITISISRDDTFGNVSTFDVDAESIKNVGKDRYLLIPSNSSEAELIDEMSSFPETFFSLGYVFKTGPVVEFRNKKLISSAKKTDSVPMFRSLNILDDVLVFPAETSKAQYVSASAKNLLIRNEDTVFIKRLSAKEESKRIQSCVYHRSGDNRYISVENHVNYVARRDGKPLTRREAEWIHSLLSSEEYDTFFRLLNGSTQVNASELNYLPVRSIAI